MSESVQTKFDSNTGLYIPDDPIPTNPNYTQNTGSLSIKDLQDSFLAFSQILDPEVLTISTQLYETGLEILSPGNSDGSSDKVKLFGNKVETLNDGVSPSIIPLTVDTLIAKIYSSTEYSGISKEVTVPKLTGFKRLLPEGPSPEELALEEIDPVEDRSW